jgi:hypothetical protein
MKVKIVFFFLVVVFSISCNNEASKIKEIKNILEQNCNCRKIVSEISKNDTIGTITFNLYDCKNGTDYKEADRIVNILRSKVDGFCNMEEKINLQFVTTNEGIEKYFPNVYWKCTIQFEF